MSSLHVCQNQKLRRCQWPGLEPSLRRGEAPERCRGVTLLELLIVIFIIVLLAAAATRIMRPALEGSQVREAGRILTTLLGTARNVAMQTRRNTGVMFVPSRANANASMDLVMVECPPPYAGDSLSSRIRIKTNPAPVSGSNPPAAVFTVEFPQSDAWTSQVAVGNTLQFNYQGHIYLVEDIDNSDTANPKLRLSCPTVARLPQATPNGDPGMTFQFFRGPKEGTHKPSQLPVGSAVDLLASGIGDGTFAPNATQPVIITFNPSGQLDMVYWSGAVQGQRVTQNVFLLVGRPEGAGTSANINDKRNVWVSIACQSGTVGIDANAQVWSPGADTKWGVANTDDDLNGATDDISEAGRTGSDDVVNTNADVTSASDRKSARRLAAGGKNMGG